MKGTDPAATPSLGRTRTHDVILVCVSMWMVIVTILGARLAWDLAGEPLLSGVGRSMFLTAGLIYAACLGLTLIAWRLRPTVTVSVAVGTAGAIVSMAALVTGSMVVVAVVVATAIVAWLVGEAAIGGIFPARNPYLVRVVVAFALGNALLGVVFLLLGSLDQLNTAGLLITLSVIAAAAAAMLVRRDNLELTTRWTPSPASWWEAVLLGTASGLVAFALLTSLMPETISDAVRGHLPVTRQIWQTGSTSGLAWPAADLPIHAQLVSIVGWSVGGDIGVKLSHALVGLATVAGVSSLGWLLAGRTAAVVAAVIFATIPIVLWEVGHAYVDLYPALFITTSAISVVIWQQSGRRAMLVIGGALAGFAFVAKVVSASAVAGIGFAVALIGRGRWRLRDRVEAVAIFSLGGLASLPWLYWSYQKTGSIPGLDYALNALLNPSSDIVGNLDEFGIGRDPLSILTVPWAATFQGELFNEAGAGNFGILPLVALPAILFAPRTRTVAFVAVAAAIAYFGWAFSAQYFRYGLPLFALACALMGAGLAGLFSRLSVTRAGRPIHLLCGLLVVGLAITPVLTMTNWIFRMPPRYFTGELSREELLAQYVLGYRVFDRSTAIVGAGNTLEWVGFRDIPRIFSEAVILGLTPPPVGTPTTQVLNDLGARGASYFAWERNGSDPSAWQSPLLSLKFLRDHTKVVYAADNAYLFEVFEEPRDRWGFGAESLLSPAPGQSAEDSEWALVGDVDTSGSSTVIRAGAGIHHEVPVLGGSPYLLVAESRCAGADDRLILSLAWVGDDGPMSMEWQLLAPGEEFSEQFVWATSLETATNAQVQVSAWGNGTCMVEDVTLHEGMPPDG